MSDDYECCCGEHGLVPKWSRLEDLAQKLGVESRAYVTGTMTTISTGVHTNVGILVPDCKREDVLVHVNNKFYSPVDFLEAIIKRIDNEH